MIPKEAYLLTNYDRTKESFSLYESIMAPQEDINR